MSQKLRPCLCGSGDIELLKAVDGDTYPHCKTCHLTGELCIDEEAAISRWNTRPTEDALRNDLAYKGAVIAALYELVEAYQWERYLARLIFVTSFEPSDSAEIAKAESRIKAASSRLAAVRGEGKV